MSRSFLYPWIGPWLGLLIISSTLSPASAQFVLSEFLAVNLRNLPDEEGAFEDWIEVRNTTTEVANLAGWYLTDSSRDLRKWQFPATNIQAGASIVVFASNKDRRQPGRPFHTNFRLSQSGEFLALVKPDGVTTVTSFSPTFPPQAADVSYGFGLITTNYSLAQATAPRRVLVPSAANLGSTLEDAWKGGAEPFNDSGWLAASGAAGYSGPDVSLVAVADLAFRFNFEAAPVANAILDSKPAGTPRNGNNSRAVWTANAEDRDSSPNARSGVMQFVATNASQITVAANPDINVPSGTVAFWMLSSGLTGPGTDPAAILDRRGTSGGLLLQQGTDGRLLVTARSGASTVRNSFSSGASVGDNRWHHVAVVFDQSAGGTISVYVDGQLDASGSNTGAWAWPTNTALGVGRVSDAASSIRRYNGFLDDVRFYKRVLTSAEITEVAEGDGEIPAAEIQLDLAGAMRGIQSSAFVRIPFSITDPATVDSLLIKLRYDDGYAMWINGRLVGRGNSPEVPTWDSAAVGARSAAFSETLIQTVSPGLLRSGANILAIQAMNASAADATFFIGAELSAFAILDEGTAPIFFTRPTPGEVNGAGVRTPGPAILETAHAPRVPQDHENLLVTARVAEVFTAVSNVVLRYRINFGAEVTLPMSDEGTDGDLLPGDGIYTARIPATASTNGQMIRYLVLASDVAGNTSRWPLFHDPVGSAEYEGTVVAPESVQSQLPVFHLFASPQNLPRVDEETGGRLSVFHDGELYDNVYMELRGNTSAGLPKKSHRVEFHRNKRLRHPGPGGSVRLTSFIAEHLDPVYMRQGLSFWLLNETGTPAPFYYPVRLQMNGQFYQLASHTDVLSEDQLERMGYDPRGALYKAVGTVTPDQTSTGGFEKKTRTHEGNADYQAMASGINEARSIASRRTNVFEFFDVPNLINYLVCARWVQEADDVWANMSLYVDSEGDKRWRVIPFDMNLSWGALYYGDNPSRNEGVISIDDENKSHPLYGGSQVLPVSGSLWNRLYDAVITVPETRQMLLRRMRTVMDEWIQPPTTHPSLRKFEQRISALTNQMWADAFIDRDKWRWPSLGGPYGLGDNQWLTNATRDLVQKFIEPRRRHWYVTHAATNTARPIGVGNNRNAGIPEAQAEDVLLTFGPLDFYPSATSQAGEYLTITNPHSFAVDISGWKLRGGVSFTFGGGTVIPSNGVLYVVKSVPHFKARSAGPRGGLGLFVVGPYQGQLSSRGESLTLIDRSGRTAASIDYPGNPTEVQQQLRITEIMYQPAPPAAGSPYRASDFEYIELRNIGSAALDLDGVHFTNGLSFSFTGSPAASLAGGERTVVVKNLAAFVSRYGNSPKVAGVYEGALDNAGERITLLDRAGEVVLDFTYRRTWLPLTDGPGFSLVVRDDNLPYSLWSSNGLWVTSATDSGTPGAADRPSAQMPAVLVNEVLCSPLASQGGEFIELHNPTGQAVDISGWYLSDDFLVPRKYRLQNGSQIPAGGYLVLTDVQFEAGAAPLPGFALGNDGDDVHLFSADNEGRLTGYHHGWEFGGSEPGITFGRHLDVGRRESYIALQSPTPGAANSGPRESQVIISEVHYHPAPPAGPDFNREFVEVANLSDAPVALFDPAAGTNVFRLRGDVDFEFPTGIVLAGHERVVVVGFDPLNAAQAAAFRAEFGAPSGLRIFGPFRGNLSNDRGRVRLQSPAPVSALAPEPVYYVVSEVEHHADHPWLVAADGFGASLHRSWLTGPDYVPPGMREGLPSPGLPAGFEPPPDIIRQPLRAHVLEGRSARLQPTLAAHGARVRYQWILNGDVVPWAQGPALELSSARLADGGAYQLVIVTEGGSSWTRPTPLVVFLPAFFAEQPQGRSVLAGTNITLRAQAIGTGDFTYQWRRNGVALPGRNSESLSLVGATPADTGVYDVVFTDEQETIVSQPAPVTVSIRPAFIIPPQPLTVVQGDNAVFFATVSGTAPLTFRWNRSGRLVTNITTFENTGVLVFRNVQPTNSGPITLTVTNLGGATAQSLAVSLTVLADADRDGQGDLWEGANGLSVNDSADGGLDMDGDRMLNRDEFSAGTNPRDPESLLKLTATAVAQGTLLQFQAMSNRAYTVQYRTTLSGETWQKLTDVLWRPTNRIAEVIHTNTLMDPGFYRVITPSDPGLGMP